MQGSTWFFSFLFGSPRVRCLRSPSLEPVMAKPEGWTCLKMFWALLQGRGQHFGPGAVWAGAVCPRGLLLAVSHFKASPKGGIHDECSSGATLPGYQSWLLPPAYQMTLDTCLELSESWSLIVSREDWMHLPGLPWGPSVMIHAKSLAWHQPWKGLSGHLLFVSPPLFPGRKLRPRGAKCLETWPSDARRRPRAALCRADGDGQACGHLLLLASCGSFPLHLPASLGFSPSPLPWKEVAQKPLPGRCSGGGDTGEAGVTGKQGMRAKCTVPVSLPSRYAHPPVSFSSFVKICEIPASDLKNFLTLMGIWIYPILVHCQRGERQGNGEGTEVSACHFFSFYSRAQALLPRNKSGERETHRLWKPLADVSGCATSISDSPCGRGLSEPGWGETRNRRDSAAPGASLSQVPRRLSQQGSNPQCSWTKVLQTSLLFLLCVNTRP